MVIKKRPHQPLPTIAVLLGLIIAGFALYGLVKGVWELSSVGAVVKEVRSGGRIGTSQPFFVEVSGIAAWLRLMGMAGLVAVGFSAVLPWLRSRFVFFFSLTVGLLVMSNLLSGKG